MGARVPALLISLAILGGCGEDGPSSPPTRVLWRTAVPPGIHYASPALTPDGGAVIVGTSVPWGGGMPGAHAVVALEATTGEVRWRHSLDVGQVRSTPAIAGDGSIYVAVELPGGDELLALSATGEELWRRDVNPSHVSLGIGLSPPAIAPDGTVIVAGDRLRAFSPEGTPLWSALGDTGEALRSAPAIGADGTVYFATHNVPLTALDPTDGSVRWSLPLGVNDHAVGAPSIGADGRIYVPTDPGILFAVSPSGQMCWTFGVSSLGLSGHLRGSPAIDAEGNLYLGLTDAAPHPAMISLGPDGTHRWTFVPGDLPAGVPLDHLDMYTSPALGADGSLFFGMELGRVYAVDAATGELRWMVTTRTGITWPSPALGADGSLYVADMDGMVYAIRTGSGGPQPGSPWPQYRHDASRTGHLPAP